MNTSLLASSEPTCRRTSPSGGLSSSLSGGHSLPCWFCSSITTLDRRALDGRRRPDRNPLLAHTWAVPRTVCV